jgi:membrane protease YdiL (CAAX protease family)
VLTLPLPLIILANAGVGKSWAGVAAEVLSGLVGGAFSLIGILDLAGVPVLSSVLAFAPTGDWRYGMDVTITASGFLGAAVAANPVRRRLSRVSSIEPDNPVHALALTLAVILFGGSVALVSFTNVLGSDLSQPPLNATDLIFSEAPLLILGLAGVGLFMRRGVVATANRLALLRPAWWHPVIGLAAAGVFVAVAQLMIGLSYAVTPELAHRVDAASQHVFGSLSSAPVGIALLALVPGLCEDILFRGALQPRIGLLATALLFTSTHTEYGLSFVTLAVFVLALGLGYVRKYTNTTTSMLCHVSYNLLVGIGIAGVTLDAAIGVEVILLAVAGYAIWTNRRRIAAASSP